MLRLLPILIAAAILWPSAPVQADDNPNAITSEQEAIDRALLYTGFDIAAKTDDSTKTAMTASAKMVSSDSLIFDLTDSQKDERTIWQVDFANIKLVYNGKSSTRDYTVMIDSLTGQLLEIHTLSEKYGNTDTHDWPTNEKLISGLEMKNVRAKDSLIYCIMDYSKAMESSFSSSDHVFDILAYYHYGTSPFNQTIRPMWYIILRGFTPAMIVNGVSILDAEGKRRHSGELPERARNSLIQGIDATTGKRQFLMSMP